MILLTENNKDYLFQLSSFYREIFVQKELTMTDLINRCDAFTEKLVDECVIQESYAEELKTSLVKILTVMVDNPVKDENIS